MKFPEKHRIAGELSNYGMFAVRLNQVLVALINASDGEGWEHVSVSIKLTNKHGKIIAESERCPTWEEMCIVKGLFWNETETVVQFHPPKSEYVSNHPYVLHLWKPVGYEIKTPPAILVGIPGTSIQKI